MYTHYVSVSSYKDGILNNEIRRKEVSDHEVDIILEVVAADKEMVLVDKKEYEEMKADSDLLRRIVDIL